MQNNYLNLDYSKNTENTKQILEILKAKLNSIFQKEVPFNIVKIILVITSNKFTDSKDAAKKKLISSLKKEDKVIELMDWLENEFLEEFNKIYDIKTNKEITEKTEPTIPNKENIEKEEIIIKDKEEISLKKREKTHIFDRLVKKDDKKLEGPKQVNKDNIVTDTMKEIEEKGLKKKRCTYWLNCKNEDCKFVHPKEECKKFPNCIFKDECIYIHPKINCKFNVNCKNNKCNFLHPKVDPLYKAFAKFVNDNGYNKNAKFQKHFK